MTNSCGEFGDVDVISESFDLFAGSVRSVTDSLRVLLPAADHFD